MSEQSFDQSELDEFAIEARELLDSGEEHLLEIERGGPFSENYDAIFRVFHSLKGAAGMLGFDLLQSHMHHLESLFSAQKDVGKISAPQISFFLTGVDAARKFFDTNELSFSEKFPSDGSDGSEEEAKLKVSSPKEKEKPQRDKKKLSGENGLVFIIDDEPDIVELLSDAITSIGYEVIGFTDANKALEAVKSKKPDLVFTDIKMPKMTGVELLTEIFKFNSELPIIFVSGFVDKKFLLEAIGNGVYAVIEKPFDTKRILSLCKNAVRRYRLVRLLNKSINLIMYQFSDLDDFLKSQGKEDIRKEIRNELDLLLEMRKELRSFDRG